MCTYNDIHICLQLIIEMMDRNETLKNETVPSKRDCFVSFVRDQLSVFQENRFVNHFRGDLNFITKLNVLSG